MNLYQNTKVNYQKNNKLNDYQKEIYQKVVFGRFHKTEKDKECFLKAKEIINKLKNKRADEIANVYLSNLYPKSKLVKFLCKIKPLDEETYENKQPLKELMLTYEDIVDELIKNNILPSNFMNLNKEWIPKRKYVTVATWNSTFGKE